SSLTATPLYTHSIIKRLDMKNILILISTSLLFFSCSPYLMENKSPLRHTYILNISEEQGKTIDKLEVSYSIKQSDRIKLDTTFTTTLPKTILADYLVYPDEKAYSFERYKTKFEYVIKINDYFYDDGYITSSYDGSSWSIDKSINEKNINLKKINYKLVVTDIDGVPIEDAKVEYT